MDDNGDQLMQKNEFIKMILIFYLDKEKFLSYYKHEDEHLVKTKMENKSTDEEKGDKEDSTDKNVSEENDVEDEEESLPDELEGLTPEEQQSRLLRMSARQMLLGTFLVLMFSDPLVGVLSQLGKVMGINAFYIAFVLAPLASNGSEL